MDIKSALTWGGEALGAAGQEAARRDAEILLEAAAGKRRFELFLDFSDELPVDVFHEYAGFIEKRARRMPVDYILGRTEFMSLPFYVDRGVLIPRKETEILVERALKTLDSRHKIIDLGTGSANIAVSAAFYSGCAVYASDVSGQAVETARANAALNGVSCRVKFFEGDMFEPFRENMLGDFDMIISNPPYIKTGDMENPQDESISYEPEIALDGGKDGLGFYRGIIRESPAFLKEGGLLLFETGYGQAAAVRAMLEERGFNSRAYKDYSGIDRVVEGLLTGKTGSHSFRFKYAGGGAFG